MTELTGGCACGKVRFIATGDPRFAIICHCRACQQMTGGGHAPQAGFNRDGFTVTGKTTHWDRATDAGTTVRKHFCPSCGAPVFSTTTRMEDIVMVLIGALDDPATVTPTMQVHSESRVAWDQAHVGTAS